MCRTKTQTSSLSLLFFLVTASLLTALSTAATETFVFGGCSKLKYTPGTPYESLVNSILTSLVNSAMFSTYNNFTIPSSSSSNDVVSGLFQCRGDLGSDACSRCVARAVSQLGTLCLDACGGALQLEGCFVKYDNATFLGVEDKTEVVKKCGPSIGYDSDALTRCNAVLDYLQNPAAGAGNGGTLFRTGGSGNVQGVAQCVGDLSPSECQDCVSDAIQRLKTECGPSSWGDVYLAKCYARFSQGGYHSHGKKGKMVSFGLATLVVVWFILVFLL